MKFTAVIIVCVVWIFSSVSSEAITDENESRGDLGDNFSVQQQAFLNDLAQKTWTYLSSDWATDNHLPWSWRSLTISGGDYVNTTEIGLYMLSYIGAYEMRESWSPTREAVENEIIAVLDQLRSWQTGSQSYEPHGANAYNNSVFYQWYWINWNPPVVGPETVVDPITSDTVTTDNQDVPSIDNAFLAASLITIREWAKAKGNLTLSQKADDILRDMDFMLWYNTLSNRFTWGDNHNPHGGGDADYYSNENRIINFVARALGQLTPEEYAASLNALVQLSAAYDRNTLDPDDDISISRVSWDGSYFTYTAPALFINETRTSYESTIGAATEAQIAYAQDHNYVAWGLSDCFDLNMSDYIQQGALPTGGGAPETHSGLVAPHASALALITDFNQEAVSNLMTFAQDFPAAYDVTYGLKDCVMALLGDSDYGEASDIFSALGQEWLFLAIVNFKTGIIWEYFYRDAGVRAAHREMEDYFSAAPRRNYSATTTQGLSWNRIAWATYYEVQVSRNTAFSLPLAYSDTVPQSILSVTPTLGEGIFHWRVRAINNGVEGKWSKVEDFTNVAP